MVALSQQCGLIEWIPNLLSLKLIIHSIFRRKGIFENTTEIMKTLQGNFKHILVMNIFLSLEGMKANISHIFFM